MISDVDDLFMYPLFVYMCLLSEMCIKFQLYKMDKF